MWGLLPKNRDNRLVDSRSLRHSNGMPRPGRLARRSFGDVMNLATANIVLVLVVLAGSCKSSATHRDTKSRARLSAWATIPEGTDVDELTNLPVRVIHTRTGIEMRLVNPPRQATGAANPSRICGPHNSEATYNWAPAPFYLGSTEVSWAIWENVMRGPDPRATHDRAIPATGFTIREIRQFLASTDLRLPTETEWECACRAGSVGAKHAELARVAWFAGNCDALQPCASKAPNSWGFFDMLGNAWEVVTLVGGSDSGTSTGANAAGALTLQHIDTSVALRGGSVESSLSELSARKRVLLNLDLSDKTIGFRVARDP